MKTHFLALALAIPFVATNVFAQHSDVEFGVNDLLNPTELDFEVGAETDGTPLVTASGIPFFEADFEIVSEPGDPIDYAAEDPGFATAPDEGLEVNLGDQLFVNVLDGSSDALFGGLGYVTFYNPVTNALEDSGQINVQDNTAGTQDLLLDGASISGTDNPQFVGTQQLDITTGEPAGFDAHLVFDLVDDSLIGAFGLFLQLELRSDFAGATFDSDPFLVILNRGLEEDVFEDFAVPAFVNATVATAVPEPGTLALLTTAMSCLALRRRRFA